MNLFGWRIFEDDEPKAPAAPSRGIQSWTPPPAPSPPPAQSTSDYYANHRERGRSSPGVSLAPTVGRVKPNNEGLSWWQKVINTISGGEGVYNRPGLPGGPVHYYTGEGTPYDPADIRGIVDRKNQYDAGQPAPTAVPRPTATAAAGLVPLTSWNYSQPGVAYGPSPSPVPTPARTMPAPVGKPVVQSWNYDQPGAAYGSNQAPVAPAAALAPFLDAAAQAEADAAAAASAPRFDPSGASRAAQRYLSAAGWAGAPARVAPTDNRLIDPATLRDLTFHRYQLSPWQQEQMAADYGVGRSDRTLFGDSFRTAQANAADYGALTPQQRNAMLFNQQLIAAVQADRAAVRPEDIGDYESKVSNMFGTQGGSATYAPNTMALLDKMGMGRLRGQDLDEYLSLDRAYDVAEIEALKPWDTTPEIGPYAGAGASAGPEAQLALDQRQADLAGSMIADAMSATNARGWNEQARINDYLGNRPPVEQIPFGWLKQGEARATDEDNAKEEFFQNMYDYLSSDAGDMEQFWQGAKSRNFTDADYDEIYDYFYQRSLEDDRTGPSPGYRTGAETRKLIGIG